MRLIVTGSAGFIGSNLTEYLLNKKHTVIGIDNFNDFYDPKVKEYNIREFEENPNFKLYRIDLTNAAELEKVFINEKNIDGIIHLAAWPGVTKSFDIPVVYIRNNIEATVNLLEMCKKYSINNFIFASTSSVYGKNQVPFVETMYTDMPLAPYPATKKACEVILYTYHKNYGINTSILRIFNPNGPRLRPDLAIPKLVKSCLYGYEFPQFWTKEDAKLMARDYCYVGHILDAIDYLAAHPFKYEIFNLGNSSPVTLKELIAAVEKVSGKKANVVVKDTRPGEMEITYANIEKAKRLIGYNPVTSIEDIVKIYFDWFQKQDEWYKKL